MQRHIEPGSFDGVAPNHTTPHRDSSITWSPDSGQYMGSSQEEVFRSKHQDDGLELLPFFDEQLPGPCQQGREEMQRHHGGGDGGHGGAQDVPYVHGKFQQP